MTKEDKSKKGNEEEEVIPPEEEEETPDKPEEEEEEPDAPISEEEDEEEDPENPDKPEGEEKDIDYEGDLAKLEDEEEGDKPSGPRTELEKAKRSLFFNAKKVQELGGDPSEVLGEKPKKKPVDATVEEGEDDAGSVIDRKFAERDAREIAGSDAEFKLIMWYVRNKGLSVTDAHVLANKGRIKRSIVEAKRSKVETEAKGGSGSRGDRSYIPPHPSPDILQRRGYRYNGKTKTWQGKLYEEFYDHRSKQWKSRRLQGK